MRSLMQADFCIHAINDRSAAKLALVQPLGIAGRAISSQTAVEWNGH